MTPSEPYSPQPLPRPLPLAPEPEPPFGLFEVILAFAAMLFAVLFCGLLAIAIAHHLPAFSHLKAAELAENPRILLPAQLAAYLLLIVALWRLFARHHGLGLLNALGWRWPQRWGRFPVFGILLAVSVQLVAHCLPTPPEPPVDKMMQTALDAWLMTAFGVLIAPFVEEMLFRGLLFPALARRTGALLSLLVTSALFGATHAAQLGGVWSQVSLIVLVGAVLTLVRWRSHSLASSTLVHMGYNAALFAALFVETHGFTNFSVK